MSEDMQIEIIDLLNKFDNELRNAKTVPFRNDLIFIKKDEVEELLKQIDIHLPEEYQKVRWIKSQEDCILSDAGKKADTLVRDAENAAKDILIDARRQEKQMMDKALFDSKKMVSEAEEASQILVAESTITAEAGKKADALIEEARKHSDQIVANSLMHVRELLLEVRHSMTHMLDTVNKNIDELERMNG